MEVRGLIAGGRSLWLPVFACLLISLPSLFITGAYITIDSPAPKTGVIESPYPDEPLSGGMLLIILDGVRRDIMLDAEMMPSLNSRAEDGAVLEIRSGPLTMTGSCIREMATGVPSRPSEGLNNFHPEHPGTLDGYNMASTLDADGDGEPDRRVAMLGDYVWRNVYPDRSLIPFSKHYYGHADFSRGDEEGFETLNEWLNGSGQPGDDDGDFDIIVAHLSGPDHVGHRYGVLGSETYTEKILWVDEQMAEAFKSVPPDWTVIVTSDHGTTSDGRHGSPDEEIRQVAAVMWGPNIKVGAVVEGLKQRDLATLPLVLFSLPFPYSVDGIIPLDAFDISQQKRETLELWNWEAAVERQKWLAENDWPAVEGLSKDVIEWESLPDDELGMRTIDLGLSLLAGLLVIAVILFSMYNTGSSGKELGIATLLLILLISVSASLSFYQSVLPSSMNLRIGAYATILLIGLCWFASQGGLQKRLDKMAAMENEKDGKIDSIKRWLLKLIASPWTMFTLLAFTIIYTDSRLSLGAMFLFAMALMVIIRSKKYEKIHLAAAFNLALILSTVVFLSHDRLIGFNFPRDMLIYTQPETWYATLGSSLLIGEAALLGIWYWCPDLARKKRLLVAAAFATLPLMMWFQSNYVDWLAITAILLCAGLGLKFRQREEEDVIGHRYLDLAVIAWLTISWGAWGGTVAFAILACCHILLKGPWKGILQARESEMEERWRLALLILCPWILWFSMWWSLGQVEGLSTSILHPREIDPGDMFFRGGYVGDRTSPSNEWVGFMGMGPVIAASMLLWRNLYRIGWPIHLLAAAVLLRFVGLVLQLSLSPDLPRMVFRTTWDAMFAMGIFLTIIPLLVHRYLIADNDRPSHSLEAPG